jgi:hypothetical protein
MSYLSRALAVCSEAVNVVFFNGHQNDSLSSRAYREKRHAARRFIDRLFSRWEAEHCKTSHENDVAWARQLIKDHAQ